MFDRITFYVKKVEYDSIKSKIELFVDGIDKEGADKYRTTIKGSEGKPLKIRYVGTRLIVDGSLHKYAKGNNYSLFTYEEAKDALKELSVVLGTPLKDFVFTLLEVGVNMQMKNNPAKYLPILKEYKNHPFFPMCPFPKETKFRGAMCKLSEYNIKVYDKTFDTIHREKLKVEDRHTIPENILRYELSLSRKQLKNLGMKKVTGESLLSGIHYSKLKNELKNIFGKIIFNDISIDFSGLLQDDVKRYIFVMSEHYPRYLSYLKEVMGEIEYRKEIRSRNNFLERIADKTTSELETELKEKFADAITKIYATPK